MIAEDQTRHRAGAAIRRRSPVSKKRETTLLWSKAQENGSSALPERAEYALVYSNGSSDLYANSIYSRSSRTTAGTSDREERMEKVAVSTDSFQRSSEAVRKGSRTPSGAQGHRIPTSWPSSLLGRAMHSAAPKLRNFWETNIAIEEEEKRHALRSAPAKPYTFPKWRSTDALSASLVASNSVDVPEDSVIPERRLQKMRETDREAVLQKILIHEQAEPPRRIHKGKSLDSLVMQLDYQPWYDRIKIRNSVSRESIANIAEARERFEPHSNVTRDRARRHSGHSTHTAPSEFSTANGVDSSHDRHLHEERTNTYHASDNGYQTELLPNGTDSVHNYHTRHERRFSPEEQLFILYMKQNPEVITNLGIGYSSSIVKAMDELPWRAVELRIVDGASPVHSQSPRQGRFLKKYQSTPANHIRKSDSPAKEHDENLRHAYGEMPAEKRIGSLIKYEMMQLKEREEELRKSRRDLGMPSLEETMELWKQGNSDVLSYRSAASYARMNDFSTTLMQRSSQPSELSSTNGSWDC